MIIETQNNVLVRLYVKREELVLSLKRPYMYTYPCGDPRCMVEATWTYLIVCAFTTTPCLTQCSPANSIFVPPWTLTKLLVQICRSDIILTDEHCCRKLVAVASSRRIFQRNEFVRWSRLSRYVQNSYGVSLQVLLLKRWINGRPETNQRTSPSPTVYMNWKCSSPSVTSAYIPT